MNLNSAIASSKLLWLDLIYKNSFTNVNSKCERFRMNFIFFLN